MQEQRNTAKKIRYMTSKNILSLTFLTRHFISKYKKRLFTYLVTQYIELSYVAGFFQKTTYLADVKIETLKAFVSRTKQKLTFREVFKTRLQIRKHKCLINAFLIHYTNSLTNSQLVQVKTGSWIQLSSNSVLLIDS